MFSVIAAHSQVSDKTDAAEAAIEEGRPALSQDEFTDLCSDEMDRFIQLLEVVPTTLPGVVALVTHLNLIYERDPWKFEDNYATPLIGTLAKAFGRMAMTPHLARANPLSGLLTI